MAIESNVGGFQSHLLRIRATKPDAVVFGFSQEAYTLSFLQQRAQLLADVPLYSTESSCGLLADPNNKVLFQQVWCVTPKMADKDFQDRFKNRFNRPAVFSAPNAYDAMIMLLQALESGLDSSEQVSAFLRSRSFKSAAFGELRFDQSGGVMKSEFRLVTAD